MNILTMLWKNLWGGSRTMRFPLRPKVTCYVLRRDWQQKIRRAQKQT